MRSAAIGGDSEEVVVQDRAQVVATVGLEPSWVWEPLAGLCPQATRTRESLVGRPRHSPTDSALAGADVVRVFPGSVSSVVVAGWVVVFGWVAGEAQTTGALDQHLERQTVAGRSPRGNQGSLNHPVITRSGLFAAPVGRPSGRESLGCSSQVMVYLSVTEVP